LIRQKIVAPWARARGTCVSGDVLARKAKITRSCGGSLRVVASAHGILVAFVRDAVRLLTDPG